MFQSRNRQISTPLAAPTTPTRTKRHWNRFRWRAVPTVAILLVCSLSVVAILASGAVRDYLYRELSYELLTQRIVGGETDGARITDRLISFIDESEYPGGGPVLDTNVWIDFVRGIGWCDQVSWALDTLLAQRGIPGRLVFLGNEKSRVGHTMAEVYLGGEWRVFDPLYGLVFHKPDRSLATLADLTRDISLVTAHPRVRALPPEPRRGVEYFFTELLVSPGAVEPSRWAPMTEVKGGIARRGIRAATRAYLAVLGSWGANRFQDLYLGLLPNRLVALDARPPSANRPVFRTREEDPALFLYYRARNYHLYGRAEPAGRAYVELIAQYPRSPYAEKSAFFLGTLELSSRGDFRAAAAAFAKFLKQYPGSDWAALAHHALGAAFERLGDFATASHHYRLASVDPYVDAAYRLEQLNHSSLSGQSVR